MEHQNDHQKFAELHNEIGKLFEGKNKKMTQMNEEIVGLKEKNIKLEEENRGLKDKMAKMEAYMKELKSSIRRRDMPAELMDELFASMHFENAFGLMAKMPNGLLARNVQKMINGIKEALKNNKLNERDCGSKISISEDGIEAKHSGPFSRRNSVRTVLSIPSINFNASTKNIIVSYFEMQILKIGGSLIAIGFCDKKIILESVWLGMIDNPNSIGFYKYGIWIEGDLIKFENATEYFNKGDFLGLGLIHYSKGIMQCFATWNGKMMGKAKLPSKFAQLQLYPTINLRNAGDSIRAHFKKEEWQFKDFQHLLE